MRAVWRVRHVGPVVGGGGVVGAGPGVEGVERGAGVGLGVEGDGGGCAFRALVSSERIFLPNLRWSVGVATDALRRGGRGVRRQCR